MTATASTIDTGVLLHATDQSSPLHEPAWRLLERLAAGPDLLYVAWPVAFKYFRAATSPALFEHPLTEDQASRNIDALLERENVRMMGGDDGFWAAFPRAAGEAWMEGDFVTRGYLVGLMRQHRVPVLWTRDRSYNRFDGITARDYTTALR
jgi:toxin-antitoxin system PIN domain toxin